MSDLTGTAYDFIRIPVDHPECGKKSLHPLRELVDRDEVECQYCGGIVDISSEQWRGVIAKLSEEYKQIKFTRRS